MKRNRMYKKLSLFFVACAILFTCAFTTFRGEAATGNANVVTARTPIDIQKGGTLWTRSFSNGTATSYNSIPILTSNNIYIVNRDQLYELDYNGAIIRQHTLSAKMNSVCYLLLEDDTLYIPLSGGIMEAVDIKTSSLQTKWISNTFGGQSLATVFCYKGYVYSASTSINNQGTTGCFYCLDASNGKTVWQYKDDTNPGGYYWSGGIVHNNALYFCGDNGILVSHSLTTTEVYDTRLLTDNANIRSGITYDSDTNALYTADNSGTLYQITTEDNTIETVNTTKIAANVTNCTSTPTVYKNRIYIGGIANKTGIISVINAKNLSPCYTVTGADNAEIKSSPLVSTRGNTDGTVYIYVSANASPGGIYYFKDSENTTNTNLQTLYTPALAKQFCLSSIVARENGVLYYSNDSGTLFAVSEVAISSDRPLSSQNKTPIPSPTPTPLSSLVSTVKKDKKITVKKPAKVSVRRLKKHKKKYRLTWKRKQKNSQTIVYIKKGQGKWKRKLIKKKTNLTIYKKGKKKYRIRLRSRIKKDGKWCYSSYTKIIILK